LRKHCLECHNADEAKNDYRVDEADEFLAYVEPGDAESSMVYYDYMLSEDPDLMMPPASHGGPLSPAELSLVRVWINEGADWPEDVVLSIQTDQPQQAVIPPTVPKTLLARVYAFQGYLHPATVHFPIALLLIGALFVVLGWIWPALGTQIPLACLILGAASSVVATLMGWAFSVEQGYGGWTKFDMDSEIFWHRWSGVIVAVTASVLALIALASLNKEKSSLNRVWRIGLLVVAGMVGAVGHQGGELTYGHDFYPKAFRILVGTPEASADEESLPVPATDEQSQPAIEDESEMETEA